MAYHSGFFDAVDQGGGNYDRVYSASDFAHYFSLFVGDGVFLNPSTSLQVTAKASPGMAVTVNPGSGWIKGYYLTIPTGESETLTIPTAHASLPRIDSVIMGLDFTNRQIRLYVKSGTAAASPSPATLTRTNSLHELELAQVTVAAGVISVTQANIKDMRYNATRCGLVKGLIDQIDATAFFDQYQDQFNTWFSNLQTNLNDDAAGYLENKTNEIQSQVNLLGENACRIYHSTYTGTGNYTAGTPKRFFSYGKVAPRFVVVSHKSRQEMYLLLIHVDIHSYAASEDYGPCPAVLLYSTPESGGLNIKKMKVEYEREGNSPVYGVGHTIKVYGDTAKEIMDARVGYQVTMIGERNDAS